MSELTLKQVAEMKKEFLDSEFGKLCAQKITEIHGHLHELAEDAATNDLKVTYIDRAYGVNQVIRFFTADVALLEQGYFNEKEKEEAEPNTP
ncbi:MAG TPA: hypothetical protein VJ836_00740 [Candidatus Saccharimonadales bacterium]|nr:hypothetical protein [Candidatus Saccharimonadales bacterium]